MGKASPEIREAVGSTPAVVVKHKLLAAAGSKRDGLVGSGLATTVGSGLVVAIITGID